MFFEENFPDAEDDDDLERTKKAYSDLDEIYVVTGSIPERRDFVETLWKLYEPYSENDFIKKAKRRGSFNERTWELYIGSTLLSHGYSLIPKKEEEGPDLCIKYKNINIWIEATAPGRGQTDAVPSRPVITPGEIYSGGGNIEDDYRPRVLRMTHAIKDKKAQYLRNLNAEVIKENDPFVVAINGYEFSGLGNLPDYLIKWTFFAAGPLQYRLQSDGSLGEPTLAYRPKVDKNHPNGIVEIECGLFNDESYKEISAVIFTFDHLINANKEKLGNNLIIARNPFAQNSLPNDFWAIGREWSRDGNQIIYKNHDSDEINAPF